MSDAHNIFRMRRRACLKECMLKQPERIGLPLVDAALDVIEASERCNLTAFDGGLLLKSAIVQMQRILREGPP